MPRISSPRPLDLTKPFVTSSQAYGSQPFDLSDGLVTWYRDIQGDFVPDLSGHGNTARCAGSGSFLPVTSSVDTPEFNSGAYDIESFGFGLGSTNTTISSLRSINANGFTSALDDHSFVDNNGDVPFSISFWAKTPSSSGVQYLLTKGITTGTVYEWSVYFNTTNLRVILYSQGGNGNYYLFSADNVLTTNTWQHFVVTYDGEGSSSSVKIYVDGLDASIPAGSQQGTYAGMIKSTGPFTVGTMFSNTALSSVSTSYLKGSMHSIAVWKRRVLTSTEAAALYYAYLNGPGGEARSGFISRSPRILLRELDDHLGSYPTVRRTGDSTRAGSLATNFDDTTTIVFSASGRPVFPSMLPRGSSFNSQAVDIIGQESDISISAPIRSFQQPTYLHYSPEEEMGPFKEQQKDFDLSSFFLTGTEESSVPGLSCKLSSKSILSLTFNNSSPHYVTRYSSLKGDTVDPTGVFAGTDVTGFCYFNFNNGNWENKGAVEVGTNIDRNFSTCVSYEKFGSIIGNTKYNVPFQFSWSPNTKTVNEDLGYSSIGHPTILGGAPSSGSVYHATSSQTLKMRNTISSPFLLEKLTISLPVSLRHDGAVANMRDIENYTVFLYRQSRKGSVTVDGSVDIASSSRHIIASASICVVDSSADSSLPLHSPNFSVRLANDDTWSGRINLELTPSVASAGTKSSSRLIGSCSFYNEGVPVGEGGWPYKLPRSIGYASPTDPGPAPVLMQNFWHGGRTYDRENSHTPLAWFQTFPGISGSVSPPVTGINAALFPLQISVEDIRSYNLNIVKDDRDVRNLAGLNPPNDEDVDFFQTYTSIDDYDQSNRTSSSVFRQVVASEESKIYPSPYLLLPGDEIVLGIDAGIPADKYYFGTQTTAYQSPGSYMIVNEGEMTINMYGSLLRDSYSIEPSLNQNLSSDSVHEIVGTEPVLDQFQIEPKSSYYGSHLEEITTGNMATPIFGGTIFATTNQDQSRRVISRVSLGQAGTTGSLQRFVKTLDISERSFDSCLPSYETFLSGTNGVSVSITSSFGYFSTPDAEYINFTGPPSTLVESGSSFYRNQFPFVSNPARLIEGTAHVWSGSFPIATDLNSFRTYQDFLSTGLYLPAAPSDLIFRVGYDFSVAVGPYGVALKHRKALSSNSSLNVSFGPFRYGISSTKPEFSSCRWRSDHYGHLRDMLEPRQLVARYDGFKTVRIRFVSGSTAVDPMLTYSQNLSTFATSSMPYFDDSVARNRPDNPDETLVEVIA